MCLHWISVRHLHTALAVTWLYSGNVNLTYSGAYLKKFCAASVNLVYSTSLIPPSLSCLLTVNFVVPPRNVSLCPSSYYIIKVEISDRLHTFHDLWPYNSISPIPVRGFPWTLLEGESWVPSKVVELMNTGIAAVKNSRVSSNTGSEKSWNNSLGSIYIKILIVTGFIFLTPVSFDPSVPTKAICIHFTLTDNVWMQI